MCSNGHGLTAQAVAGLPPADPDRQAACFFGWIRPRFTKTSAI